MKKLVISGLLVSLLSIGVLSGCMSREHAVPNYDYYLYVTNSNSILMYKIVPDTGELNSLGSLSLIGTGSHSTWANPNGHYIYVANKGSNDIERFSVSSSTGVLTSLGSQTDGSGPNFITGDPTGKFVYIANDNSISEYKISLDTGALLSLGTLDFQGDMLDGIAIDPSSKNVYITNWSNNKILMFRISSDTGTLSNNISGTSPDTMTHPDWVVVDPNGPFVYVVNDYDDTISMFRIDLSTGVLLSPQWTTGTIYANPSSIAVDPKGLYAFVPSSTWNKIVTFNIAQNTGQLSYCTEIDTGSSQLKGITIDPTGQFLYVVTNISTGSVFAYKILANGALNPIGTYSGGISPDSIAIAKVAR